MRIPFVGTSTALALVLASVAGRAEQTGPIPVTIPHYGRLLGPNDQPLTGAHKLTFKIYDAALGGTAVYSAEYQVNLGSDGTYDLQLGDAQHPFDMSKLAGGARWIGVTLDQQPEFQPRLAFGSVLYALRAHEAQNVKGGTVDGVSILNSTLENPTVTGGTFSGGTITDATIAATSVNATNLVAQKITASGGTIEGVKLSATEINLNGKPVGADSVAKSGDTMTGPLTAPRFVSTTTTEAPLQVASSQLVQNLNAELLNGKPSGDYLLKTEVRSNQNLVHNTSMEASFDGPSQPPNWFSLQGPLVGSSAIKRVAGFDGASAVSLVDQDFNNRVVLKQVIFPSGGAGLAGRTFTAQISFKKQTGAAGIKGQLCLADKGADNNEATPACVPLDGTSEWKTASITFTTSGAPDYLKVYFTSTTNVAEAAEYSFDALSVVEGTSVTFYAPHAEDFLSGMIAMFDTSCPAGWSESANSRGRVARGWDGTNATAVGGSDDAELIAHTHAVSGTTVAAGTHNHGVSGSTSGVNDHTHKVVGPTSTDGNHSHPIKTWQDDWNVSGGNGKPSWGADNGTYAAFHSTEPAGSHSHSLDLTSQPGGAHTHSFNVTSADSGSHTHTFSATTASTGTGDGRGKNVPAFRSFVFCRKL